MHDAIIICIEIKVLKYPTESMHKMDAKLKYIMVNSVAICTM